MEIIKEKETQSSKSLLITSVDYYNGIKVSSTFIFGIDNENEYIFQSANMSMTHESNGDIDNYIGHISFHEGNININISNTSVDVHLITEIANTIKDDMVINYSGK